MSSSAFELIKSTNKLPSPQGVALQLMQLAKNPDTTIEQMSVIVESDPATASRVIKYVNSPLAGMASEVSSLEKAIIMLGTARLLDLALATSLLTEYNRGACLRFDYQEFWSSSLVRAVVARHLAGAFPGVDADEAFTCGLLSGIGRLAFAAVYPSKYNRILRSAKDASPEVLTTAECEYFGLDHCALTAHMMMDWGLPEYYAEAVIHEASPVKLATCHGTPAHQFSHLLHIGNLMTQIFLQKQQAADISRVLTSYGLQIKLPESTIPRAFDPMVGEWQHMGQVFTIPTRRVPMWQEVCTSVAI